MSASSPDLGPIYTETDFTRFPAEPWNTASNIIFLFLILYFVKKTRLDYKKYGHLVFGLPVLTIGFIGGTLFHGTRASKWFLFMDFIPIFILGIWMGFVFWYRVVNKRLLAALLLAAVIIIPRFIFSMLPIDRSVSISLGYVSLALAIVLPLILYCRMKGWRHVFYVWATLITFSIAIGFRIFDSWVRDGYMRETFPAGTHFLWHLMGGIGLYFLMQYIYLAYEDKANASHGLNT